MAGTANQIIGNKPSTRDSDFIKLGTNDAMRLCVFNRETRPMWIREIGAILGRAGATACDYRLVAYICGTSSSKETPHVRACYVGLRTVNSVMTDKDGGTVVQYQISVSDTGPHASKGALIPANTYYALGYELDAGGPLGHGYQKSSTSYDNNDFYDITGVNLPPTAFPGDYNHYDKGHMSVWALADENEAPMVPINRAPSGIITTQVPTFQATFRDNNGRYRSSTDAGDVVSKINIQVRNNQDTAIIWNPTYDATATEQATDEISRTYTGPTLLRGQEYAWRMRFQDSAGEWGEYSGWLAIQPSQTQYVTLTAPNGKQYTKTPTIAGRWNSSFPSDQYQAQLFVGGKIVDDTSIRALVVAAGATFSFAWPSPGFLPLGWGITYDLRMRMHSVSGGWSDYASVPGGTFNTNAPPLVPDNLSPSGNAKPSTAPLLKCLAIDPDDPVESLIVRAKLYDAATNVQVGATLNMPYNPSTGYFEVASGVTIKKAYYWQALAYDGYLYSGEDATVEANAKLSRAATFTFVDGPIVTITSPTNGGTITNSATPLVWVCSTQATFQWQMFRTRPGTPEKATTQLFTVASATTKTFTPPSGLARKGDTVRYYLKVIDGSNLFTEISTSVLLTYAPPPTPTNFSATPYKVRSERQQTAIWLAWDQTDQPNFIAYLIYRDDSLDPIARIENALTTIMVDYAANSGENHTYELVQIVRSSDGLIENPSDPATASAYIKFSGIVLYHENDPEGARIVLEAWDERSSDQSGSDVILNPWSANAPVTVRGPAVWYLSQLTLPLITDDASTFIQKRDTVMTLGALGGPHIVKTGYGMVRRVTIPSERGVSITDARSGLIRVSVQLRDEATGVWD